MEESPTVSSVEKSIEVDMEFQVTDHFVLGVRIYPNVLAFLLGDGDK